jgi:threonine dehydratase
VVHARRAQLADIEAAAASLTDVLAPTPLISFGDEDDALQLKPEVLQVIGSFKLRGVYHAVATMEPATRARGISTVSAGNTAQALAWCGRHFGVEARSVMPEGAPEAKIEKVRALGGTPVLVPTEEVFRFLREHLWEGEPYGFVHPWTDSAVHAGHGTLALELLDEQPALETVYVPVGGGGLLGGVGSALRARAPGVRIVAVEPAGCPSLHASRASGAPAEVACETICDGVAVPYITAEMFPLLDELADDVVLVSEEEVRAAMRLLATRARLVAEPSGALALAAALRTPREERGRSVCLVTGGSVNPALLAEVLAS